MLTIVMEKKGTMAAHTLELNAHSGDNWQMLTIVMEKKGTMAAHTLELPSPDVRRWNLKQTIPFFNVRDIIIARQSEMANTSPRHMPVLGNVHPIKIENFDIFS